MLGICWCWSCSVVLQRRFVRILVIPVCTLYLTAVSSGEMPIGLNPNPNGNPRNAQPRHHGRGKTSTGAPGQSKAYLMKRTYVGDPGKLSRFGLDLIN